MLVFFFASTILAVVAYRFIPVYATPLMFMRSLENIGGPNKVLWHHTWVPLADISKHLPVAVMASEDQRFLLHHGFDYDAIQKAAKYNRKSSKKRGASTISQQTAKNVFLWQGRSWLRKGLEVYFTALIELCWSKERIMEVYLNVIEMGDGVYGAEAVAQLHFGCSAGELTRNQCALIAASLPNPLKLDSARPSRYLMRRQKAVMTQMKHVPLFTAKKD